MWSKLNLNLIHYEHKPNLINRVFNVSEKDGWKCSNIWLKRKEKKRKNYFNDNYVCTYLTELHLTFFGASSVI